MDTENTPTFPPYFGRHTCIEPKHCNTRSCSLRAFLPKTPHADSAVIRDDSGQCINDHSISIHTNPAVSPIRGIRRASAHAVMYQARDVNSHQSPSVVSAIQLPRHRHIPSYSPPLFCHYRHAYLSLNHFGLLAIASPSRPINPVRLQLYIRILGGLTVQSPMLLRGVFR